MYLLIANNHCYPHDVLTYLIDKFTLNFKIWNVEP